MKRISFFGPSPNYVETSTLWHRQWHSASQVSNVHGNSAGISEILSHLLDYVYHVTFDTRSSSTALLPASKTDLFGKGIDIYLVPSASYCPVADLRHFERFPSHHDTPLFHRSYGPLSRRGFVLEGRTTVASIWNRSVKAAPVAPSGKAQQFQ